MLISKKIFNFATKRELKSSGKGLIPNANLPWLH